MGIKTKQNLLHKELETTSTKNPIITCKIVPSQSLSQEPEPRSVKFICKGSKVPFESTRKNASPDQRTEQFVPLWNPPPFRVMGPVLRKGVMDVKSVGIGPGLAFFLES